ncbi:Uma2 family endonuclease [Actinocorallia lasiicapitis]
MKNEERSVTIAKVEGLETVELYDTPYALWERGELHDLLHLPETYTVEIVGGVIVVKSAASLGHAAILQSIAKPFLVREDDPGFSWAVIGGPALGMVGFGDGYIPDLMVLDRGLLDEAVGANVRSLVPDQVEMVVEVTSRSNAAEDRRPVADRQRPTKWTGYARAEIPHYLLVDANPRDPQVELWSIPEGRSGAYLDCQRWSFGEDVALPEHFGIEFSTAKWKVWPA